jgi:CHAD domain-containing protein
LHRAEALGMLTSTVPAPATTLPLPTARDHAEVLARRLARVLALGVADIERFLDGTGAAPDAVRALARHARRIGARRIDATLTATELRVAIACDAGAEPLPAASARVHALVQAAFGVPLVLERGEVVSLGGCDGAAGLVAEAARVARAYLARMRAMEIEAMVDRDPEGVHELRVAARRLRAALRLIDDADEAVAEVREVARAVGRATGPLRDFDVVMALVRATAPGGTERDALLHALAARRAPALHALRCTLGASQYLARVDTAAAVLARLSEREGGAPLAPAARGHTRQQLRKLRKRLGGDLTTPAGYHDVRRQMRRVRDVIEVFGASLPDRQRAWRRRLQPVQALMGRLNDVHVALALIPEDLAAAAATRDVLRRRQYELLAEVAAPLAVLVADLSR